MSEIFFSKVAVVVVVVDLFAPKFGLFSSEVDLFSSTSIFILTLWCSEDFRGLGDDDDVDDDDDVAEADEDEVSCLSLPTLSSEQVFSTFQTKKSNVGILIRL